jgi:hypothetical protein
MTTAQVLAAVAAKSSRYNTASNNISIDLAPGTCPRHSSQPHLSAVLQVRPSLKMILHCALARASPIP